MILDGHEVANSIKNELITYFENNSFFEDKYVAIFLLSEDYPSKVYVNKKKQFGEQLGINVYIFSQENDNIDPYDINNILDKINYLNNDNKCIGILVQLPLNENIMSYQSNILSQINSKKDIDGLGGNLIGLNLVGSINFLPATAYAIFNILYYYGFKDFKGKTVSIIGQSNLIGLPLLTEFVKKFATVYSFNEFSDQNDMKNICKESDYIISATGSIGLIDETFIKYNNSQVLIDAGWGKKDGKSMGDMQYDSLKDKVKAITPVPGGVGPVTVASVFKNIKLLQETNI